MDTVDIIIPAYKPDQKFLTLIPRLEKQSVPVNQIIIMNTEQKYFDRLVYGTSCQKDYHNIIVKHISKKEFDHGKTRNRGVKYSDADYFIMMTQDALPADRYVVERLLEPIRSGKAAVSYARQIVEEGSEPVEQFTRSFNYPEQSVIKTRDDLGTLGIKTFFCSNVCAAYDRRIFDELGGFVKHTIFNEDMIYAAKAVEAGYGIAYTADACVYHSHHYTNREQLHRNFDLGVSQADHPEVFARYPAESEGMKLVRQTVAYLREHKMKRQIPHVICQSGFKYAGYLLGKNYRRIPKRLVVALSSNKEYWGQDNLIKAGSRIDATKGYGRSEREIADRTVR
ncbi:MAG: glycosyltransferase family 2 protein [Clostridiales bacterium]|nr:glycosyltransferase family 2 protein [Clostridiales bacterium]